MVGSVRLSHAPVSVNHHLDGLIGCKSQLNTPDNVVINFLVMAKNEVSIPLYAEFEVIAVVLQAKPLS
jgi:hypothetical protein